MTASMVHVNNLTPPGSDNPTLRLLRRLRLRLDISGSAGAAGGAAAAAATAATAGSGGAAGLSHGGGLYKLNQLTHSSKSYSFTTLEPIK
jgi:hypothetical protein